MPNTTNKDVSWTPFDSFHEADDHNGHKGFGSTPEAAQEALEQAQRHDVPYSEHHSAFGIITDGDKK